jgi:hypothetical protein
MKCLFAHLSGPDIAATAARVLEWPWYATPPATLNIDDTDVVVDDTWARRALAARNGAYADWAPRTRPPDRWFFTIDFPGRLRTPMVYAAAPAAFATAEEVLQRLANVPFELGSFRTVWPVEWSAVDANLPGFGNKHGSLGWACAFRGGGHGRLVSRRWLDHGPWRVLRGDGDLTLVQFHDLEVDAATALAQATAGHERMGISATGGFIQSGKPWYQLPDGLYDRDTQALEYVVAGRDVPEPEMLAACTLRRLRRDHAEQPVARVAYVFLTDAEARAHLHALWLRELECWSVEGGIKRRLDLDYHPTPPEPPAWVRALGA